MRPVRRLTSRASLRTLWIESSLTAGRLEVLLGVRAIVNNFLHLIESDAGSAVMERLAGELGYISV
jgi:hypothetical protein